MIGLIFSILSGLGIYGMMGFIIASLHVHFEAVVFDKKPCTVERFQWLILIWPMGLLVWFSEGLKLAGKGGGSLLDQWLHFIQYVPKHLNLDGTHRNLRKLKDCGCDTCKDAPKQLAAPPWGGGGGKEATTVAAGSGGKPFHPLIPPMPPVGAKPRQIDSWKNMIASLPKSIRVCGCGFGIEPKRLSTGHKTCRSCQRKLDAAVLKREIERRDICKCGKMIEKDESGRRHSDFCNTCVEKALDEIIEELDSLGSKEAA